jgi:hypothetical protein
MLSSYTLITLFSHPVLKMLQRVQSPSRPGGTAGSFNFVLWSFDLFRAANFEFAIAWAEGKPPLDEQGKDPSRCVC